MALPHLMTALAIALIPGMALAADGKPLDAAGFDARTVGKTIISVTEFDYTTPTGGVWQMQRSETINPNGPGDPVYLTTISTFDATENDRPISVIHRTAAWTNTSNGSGRPSGSRSRFRRTTTPGRAVWDSSMGT